MTTFSTTLEACEEVAEATMAFHFRKPTGVEFQPGQAIDVVPPSQTGSTDDKRHGFSIVSAPPHNELAVARRVRDSSLTRALESLSIGAAVTLDGPCGSMTTKGWLTQCRPPSQPGNAARRHHIE